MPGLIVAHSARLAREGRAIVQSKALLDFIDAETVAVRQQMTGEADRLRDGGELAA
jgi:hypothetical protein